MENTTDFRVKYSKESKYEILYKWCLQEFADDGEQVGGDYIPWANTVYFSAKEVVCQIYHSSSTINDDKEIDSAGYDLETGEIIGAKFFQYTAQCLRLVTQ